jgi:hypothetical protein
MTLFLTEHLGKDHSKGMRGHSSRLAGHADPAEEKDVRPRWAEPVTFGAKFHNGTMVEGEVFSTQRARVRDFLKQKGGFVPRSEIESFLGGEKKTAQKAIQRAVQEEAIVEGIAENKGKFTVRYDSEEFFGSNV